MSIKRDLFAGYFCQITTAALTFFVVPFYLKWLGASAYGLVAIASMLQAWIMLLNSGLAPVVGRNASLAHAKPELWEETAQFIRSVDWFIAATSALLLLVLAIFIKPITHEWLGSSDLPVSILSLSLIVMIATILVRLASGVNYGVLINTDKQVWQNTSITIFSILRFLFSLPIVYFFPHVIVLFSWWLAVSLLEFYILKAKVNSVVNLKLPFFYFNISCLTKQSKMAGMLAFTSIVWVFITNTDKLILSATISLKEYGYFSIATLLASGLLILSQPIMNAFQSRLTQTFVLHGKESLNKLFLHCTQLVCCVVIPVAMVILCMPKQVLYIWTHNAEVAEQGFRILQGYLIGNILLALSGLFYVYQVAIGVIKYHVRGNIIFAIFFVPVIPFVARKYGGEGAAILWAVFNLAVFFAWNYYLLTKIADKIKYKWYFQATLPAIAVSATISIIMTYLIHNELDGVTMLLSKMFLMFVMNLILQLSLHQETRGMIMKIIKKVLHR